MNTYLQNSQTDGEEDAPSGKSTTNGAAGRLRWLIIGVAFAATVLNYLDRQTLSVLAPLLEDKLGMSNQAYGRVLGAFMLAYTLANGLWGPFIDRVGTKTGYLLCVLWWSAAEVVHVFARGAFGLGVCRFLLGAGEAGNWPAAVKVVAEWFPARERALAAGIFNSGSSIGALIAPPVVAWMALHYGWRFGFGVIGSLGFLWAIAWSVLYRRPRGASLRKQQPVPVSHLLRSRFVWQFTIAKIFFDPVWYFYIFWFPEYLKSSRGFSLREIGATAWIPFVAADLGNLAGGLAGGWMMRRAKSAQATRKRTIVLFMLLMTAAIPAATDPNTAHLLLLVSLAAFGYTAALANMLALPGDAFPQSAVASVWGIASMGAGFGGMIFSVMTGWMVDRWSFTPAFWLFGGLPLIAAALIHALPRVAPTTAEAVSSKAGISDEDASRS